MTLIKPKLENQSSTGITTIAPAPTYASEIEVFSTNNPTVTPTVYELSADDQGILLVIEEEENIQNSPIINLQDINETDKTTTDEEILYETEIKKSAITMLEEILSSAQASLNTQDNSDGWISEWFDAFKQTNGIDLTQSTVESAIKKQEEIINKLKETLENDEDFESKWEELTGVKYDEEKILKYQQKTTENQFVQMGLIKLIVFAIA